MQSKLPEILVFLRTLSIVLVLKNKLRKTRRRFGNWICFRPQVRERPILLGPSITGLALSKGPNRIGFSLTWGRKQIQFPKRRVFLSLLFNTRTMDRVRKPNISESYTPSSESYSNLSFIVQWIDWLSAYNISFCIKGIRHWNSAYYGSVLVEHGNCNSTCIEGVDGLIARQIWDFHAGNYEGSCLLGCYVVYSGRHSPTSQRNVEEDGNHQFKKKR
jgi:hypothetical protein